MCDCGKFVHLRASYSVALNKNTQLQWRPKRGLEGRCCELHCEARKFTSGPRADVPAEDVGKGTAKLVCIQGQGVVDVMHMVVCKIMVPGADVCQCSAMPVTHDKGIPGEVGQLPLGAHCATMNRPFRDPNTWENSGRQSRLQ